MMENAYENRQVSGEKELPEIAGSGAPILWKFLPGPKTKNRSFVNWALDSQKKPNRRCCANTTRAWEFLTKATVYIFDLELLVTKQVKVIITELPLSGSRIIVVD